MAPMHWSLRLGFNGIYDEWQLSRQQFHENRGTFISNHLSEAVTLSKFLNRSYSWESCKVQPICKYQLIHTAR